MTDTVIGALPVAAADELESPTRRALRRLFKRKGAVVGLVVIALFLLLALFAPLIVPYDPIATSWSLVRKPPTWQHWFGTDDLGRDILGRVVYGARASLMAGAISVGIALGIGVPLGLLSGYRGGFIDALISRITDAMLACPFLILAIALAAFLGPSLGNAMIAIGISTTPIFVRLTRGQVINVKVEDYVEAARAMGNPRWRIALFHILPNIMPALLVQATLSIAAAIIGEEAITSPSISRLKVKVRLSARVAAASCVAPSRPIRSTSVALMAWVVRLARTSGQASESIARHSSRHAPLSSTREIFALASIESSLRGAKRRSNPAVHRKWLTSHNSSGGVAMTMVLR